MSPTSVGLCCAGDVVGATLGGGSAHLARWRHRLSTCSFGEPHAFILPYGYSGVS